MFNGQSCTEKYGGLGYIHVQSAAVLVLLLLQCSPVPVRKLSVEPQSLEFGANKLNDSVRVAAPATGAKLSIHAEYDARWLSVSPTQFFSDGPNNATTLTFSVARALMDPGRNACNVVLKSAGHVDAYIHVAADAIVSADFRVSQVTARPGELVLFSDATRTLTGAKPVTSWKWDFGDGARSAEQNPVHAYENSGVYTVSLAVQSDSGSDVRVRPNCVVVREPAVPTAEFEAATRRPVVGAPVQFRDLSVPGTSAIREWLWDFGDGAWSAEQHPLHLYSAAAVYDVYLTVRNSYGTDTSLKLGYIDVQPGRR